MTTTLSPREHRTQEERTAHTRVSLIDATIRSVLEVGYPQTTTRRVAELAGVSAGAQAYHFPRRVDLVGAAIEHLADQRIGHAHDRVAQLSGAPGDQLPSLLDLLWADFSGPTFAVFIKLWVAAADEPELHARLVAVEREIARAITEVAVESVGELVARPDAKSLLLLVFSACRGLALTEHFEPRVHRRRDQWPALRRELLSSFEAR